jgi:hypothetical protein
MEGSELWGIPADGFKPDPTRHRRALGHGKIAARRRQHLNGFLAATRSEEAFAGTGRPQPGGPARFPGDRGGPEAAHPHRRGAAPAGRRVAEHRDRKLADRVSREIDPQIGRVKDMGSAAVGLTLVIVGLAWFLALAERFGLI